MYRCVSDPIQISNSKRNLYQNNPSYLKDTLSNRELKNKINLHIRNQSTHNSTIGVNSRSPSVARY